MSFSSGGYTGSAGGYHPAGIVHKGEYVIPNPFSYPKWWHRINRFVYPIRLRGWIGRRSRTYNPDKDVLNMFGTDKLG